MKGWRHWRGGKKKKFGIVAIKKRCAKKGANKTKHGLVKAHG